MKKILIAVLVLFAMYSGLLAQSEKKTQYLKPTNFQKRVTHVISEKSRNYYSLSNEKASVISVRGPGILRVISRGRFVPGGKDNIKYEIQYSINGGEQQNVKENYVGPSKKATYLNGSLGIPGELRDFEIELGRGTHTLDFKLKEKTPPVAARYIFRPTKAKKQDWIAFSPVRPTEPIDLITKEQIVKYYRFSLEKPLKTEINGPTELRVLTRMENHYQMKGRIHYRLQVKEKDKVINTYQLSSRRSEVTTYKNNKELIPGKACEFVINVPKGRHTYEIFPLDKGKSKILGRFLIPEKDVKLEK
ncbi:MAG: hypothetical protein GXO89_17010 [Chlorobi bacterium]|nr:hypothetical protein [Chlorobiota bacterium]